MTRVVPRADAAVAGLSDDRGRAGEIKVCGVFDVVIATAARAGFLDVDAVADAVLLELSAVTDLDEEFDLSGFVDEMRPHYWISGCRRATTLLIVL